MRKYISRKPFNGSRFDFLKDVDHEKCHVFSPLKPYPDAPTIYPSLKDNVLRSIRKTM